MKITVRYGIRLLCAELLPMTEMADGDMATGDGAPATYALPGAEFVRATVGPGVKTSPPLKLPCTKWVCTGISDCSSVTVGTPEASPRSYCVPVVDCPC